MGNLPQMIHVSRERLIRAMKIGSCACPGRYCDHHKGRFGQGLGPGWKMRLKPPRKELEELGEMTVRAFDTLVANTDALCADCARGHPNLLFDPSDMETE